MTAITFDPISYVKGAEKVGFTRDQAEYQAKQISTIINNELVTKSYLTHELEKTELRMLIKMGGMFVVHSGLIITVIGFMLKHT